MALDTYANLQLAIADWLDRTDLTSQIPDFITLAEAKMTRLFALRTNEVEASLTTVQGSRYVSLPSDYDLPIGLWINVWNPRRELIYRPAEQLEYVSVSSYPIYWGIDNTNIAFNCNCSGAYPLTFRYRTQDTLSNSTPTNWVLTNNPDVYLYGALAQAALFLPGEDRLAPFSQLFEKAMQDVQTHDTQNDQMATLRTEFPMSKTNNTAYNFLSGQ